VGQEFIPTEYTVVRVRKKKANVLIMKSFVVGTHLVPRNLLLITKLAPSILERPLDFCKIYAPLTNIVVKYLIY
jgi:hypothetical protein